MLSGGKHEGLGSHTAHGYSPTSEERPSGRVRCGCEQGCIGGGGGVQSPEDRREMLLSNTWILRGSVVFIMPSDVYVTKMSSFRNVLASCLYSLCPYSVSRREQLCW